MLESLVSAGIKCTYIFTPAIPAIIKEVTKALIGASALNSNGAVMSRTGTAVVAMLAHDHQIPVIVCCETYKFSDQVLLDSFVWNEIGKKKKKKEWGRVWGHFPICRFTHHIHGVSRSLYFSIPIS